MRKLGTEYIPFVRTLGEQDIVRAIMTDADIVRISADFFDQNTIDARWRLWLDPCFDGYEFVFSKGWYEDGSTSRNGWGSWIRRFPGHDLLTSEDSASSAAQGDIDEFVARVLDSVAEHNPAVISVPQVPYTQDSARHGINKKLAKAAGRWKESHWTAGTFILPAILKHHDAYRTVSIARPKISAICRSLELSRATGVWIVHAEFDDIGGVSNYERERFPSLIGFHEKLNESLPAKTITCAGPYWAINLILWARGIVDFPVIGSGGAYRYYLPKPPQVLGRQKAKPRIAIPPLRRWYGVNRELRLWIESATKKFPPRDEVRESLEKLGGRFSHFLGPGGRAPAMRQTAEFYNAWLREIAALEPRGRGLFLFRDFSKAVVNGSYIGKKLPKQGHLSSGARDPGFIAQQFMLQCLPR